MVPDVETVSYGSCIVRVNSRYDSAPQYIVSPKCWDKSDWDAFCEHVECKKDKE